MVAVSNDSAHVVQLMHRMSLLDASLLDCLPHALSCGSTSTVDYILQSCAQGMDSNGRNTVQVLHARLPPPPPSFFMLMLLLQVSSPLPFIRS